MNLSSVPSCRNTQSTISVKYSVSRLAMSSGRIVFRERREAADVAEQHRHGALVAAEADRLRRFGDSLRELRREEALEVAAREQLALNALRELAVLDGDGRDAGERDAELEVVVAEPVRRGHVVDVQNAERLAPRCR